MVGKGNLKLRVEFILSPELETIPILRAQVEVYQTDFEAERAAREKIAGEKADVLDELQRLKAATGHRLQKVCFKSFPIFILSSERL